MNHAQRYISLARKRFDSLNFGDSDYQAAFYLLSYDPKLYDVASKYVNKDGIYFAQIKKQTEWLDPTTCDIVDIAHCLFKGNSSYQISPYDMAHLGYPYLELVANALYISADQARVLCVENTQKPGDLQLTVDFSKWEQTKSFVEIMESMAKNFPSEMQP